MKINTKNMKGFEELSARDWIHNMESGFWW